MRIKTLNKAVLAAGMNIELVKGKDYFYWASLDPMICCDAPSVMVCLLNDLSFDRWMVEAKNAWDFI